MENDQLGILQRKMRSAEKVTAMYMQERDVAMQTKEAYGSANFAMGLALGVVMTLVTVLVYSMI